MIADLILWTAAGYAALGLAFAAYFVTVASGRLDPAARGTPVGVRLLLVPGAAALWPLLLRKCVRGMGGPPKPSH
jgi:hypothetical protein